ncbi:hypothetical protein RDWZM_006270 [Blomia tropicalis]|uniref:SH2 domain-containing protein n=1 Tax=Blomia tropicalis TaxID=40697 RepID=A0A9Q0M5T3_BLOTA|nr:hypothetical protein RDWZM_006270 [Blomia tropicalis]
MGRGQKESRVTISDPIRIETMTQSELIQMNGVIEVKPCIDDNPNETTNNDATDMFVATIDADKVNNEDEVDCVAVTNATQVASVDVDQKTSTIESSIEQVAILPVVTDDTNVNVSPSTETPEQLIHYPWFWGSITRKEAESLLRGQKDGTFLIRESSDKRFLYSLSFRSNGKTMHTRIELIDEHYYFYSNEPCSNRQHDGTRTLAELINAAMNQNNADNIFFYSRGLRNQTSLYTVSMNQPLSRWQYLLEYQYETNENKALQYMCKFVLNHSPNYKLKMTGKQCDSMPVDLQTFVNNLNYFPHKLSIAK